MICTSLHPYLQHQKGAGTAGTPYRCVLSEKKNSGLVANTVANVIAALLTYQLPTMLMQFVTQFAVILLSDY